MHSPDKDAPGADAADLAPREDASSAESLTREALYALVWREPMLKIAARFRVSSSYLARVCTRLRVPRPARGYWAKLAVGKAPPQPPLPAARAGDELIWVRGDLSMANPPLRPRPRPPARPRRPTSALQPAAAALREHPLLAGARPHFASGRTSRYGSEHLKPAKRLLVDLVVSAGVLDKALALANALFLALEARGHHVVIAPSDEHFSRPDVDVRERPTKLPSYNDLWSPGRCTVVYLGTVAIGLTIFEMTEAAEARYIHGKYVRITDLPQSKSRRYALEPTWTSTHDFQSGRLCLQAYAPYWQAKWSEQWRETKDVELAGRVDAIVKALEAAAPPVAELYEEGQRQAELEHRRWEAQQARWRQEEEEKRRAKALKESRDELRTLIDTWAESNRAEAFFRDAERCLESLAEPERLFIQERLRRARELLGTADAHERLGSWKTPEEHEDRGQ